MLKIEFSFDDGDQLDVNVTAPLLEKHGFRATFYIPNEFKGNKTLSSGQIKKLVENGHKVGGHTTTHPDDLKMLPTPTVFSELIRNKMWLESITTFHVESFCYPRGRHNDDVVSTVQRAGFKEARGTHVGHTDTNFDPFRKPTTLHLFQRKEYGDKTILEYFKEKLAEAESKENGYMHIWGHSAEIEREGLWSTFNEILKILKDKGYENIHTK